MTQEEANEALLSAAEEGDVETLKTALDTGAEEDYDIQQEDDEEEDEEEDDDGFDFDDEDDEEGISVWEGVSYRMWEGITCLPKTLSELLNVRENDRLMFVRTTVREASEMLRDDDEYIDIWLKREGGEWENICTPKTNSDFSQFFPEDWDWEEILDLMWNKKTVTYTTTLNEDYEQVEATWDVEE